MTHHHFNSLTEMQQIEAILVYGVLIGERNDEKHRILLYQIDDFYVESYFDLTSHKKIRDKGFVSTDLLAPYRSKIKDDDT